MHLILAMWYTSGKLHILSSYKNPNEYGVKRHSDVYKPEVANFNPDSPATEPTVSTIRAKKLNSRLGFICL